MEDKIDSYYNEIIGSPLRVYIDKNNTVWFRGKDVASSLGYIKPRNAIATHVDKEHRTTFGELGSPSNDYNEQPNTI